MKNSDIVNLLKLRFAVYKAGCDVIPLMKYF